MAETEQVVQIGRHRWIRVPSDSTQPVPVYAEALVRAHGGDPNAVASTVWSVSTSK